MTLKAARATGIALAVTASVTLLPSTAAAESCAPVENPYAGTRYDGVDLTDITAKGVKCPKARRVAKRAHREALAMAPSPDGYLDFLWNGWDVNGNLRPDHDRYRAERGSKRVRWRF